MEAGVWVVSRCLDVAVKIKVVFPYREVASQPGLWMEKALKWDDRSRSICTMVEKKHDISAEQPTCDLCFSLSFTSRSTSFCLLLVSSCSRFSRSSRLLRSSSRACLRISISRSCTRHIVSITPVIKNTHIIHTFWLSLTRYPVLEEPLFLSLGLSE